MRALLVFLILLIPASAGLSSEICLGPSQFDGLNVTVDCQPFNPALHPNAWVGYSTDGVPCQNGSCGILPGPGRGGFDYRWMISSSDVDPYETSGQLPIGISELYLWLECTSVDGWAAAEFGLHASDPGIVILAFLTAPGVLNASTIPESPLLAAGGCPLAPFLAASMTVFYAGPVAAEEETWGRIKTLYR